MVNNYLWFYKFVASPVRRVSFVSFAFRHDDVHRRFAEPRAAPLPSNEISRLARLIHSRSRKITVQPLRVPRDLGADRISALASHLSTVKSFRALRRQKAFKTAGSGISDIGRRAHRERKSANEFGSVRRSSGATTPTERPNGNALRQSIKLLKQTAINE